MNLPRPNPGSVRSESYVADNTAYAQYFYVKKRDLGPRIVALCKFEPLHDRWPEDVENQPLGA